MNILNQYSKKIKGKLDTFDRIIIKGYIRQLCNVQQFKTFLSIKNILKKTKRRNKNRNRVTRLLAKLRAHKLIKKVPNGFKIFSYRSLCLEKRFVFLIIFYSK